jgi:hypothetical protein
MVQLEESAHGLARFRDPDGALPPAQTAHHSHLGARQDMTRATLGRSRVRESRPPGSVRAKAERLSYSTTIKVGPHEPPANQARLQFGTFVAGWLPGGWRCHPAETGCPRGGDLRAVRSTCSEGRLPLTHRSEGLGS